MLVLTINECLGCYTGVMITKILTWVSFVVAVLSAVGALGIVAAELYVRWKLNQDFTFLGGESLPALIIASFGLLLGLSFVHRR
jgi:hypothetical protein